MAKKGDRKKTEAPWEVFLRLAYPSIKAECVLVANRSGQRYVTKPYEVLSFMTRCETYPKGLEFRCEGDGYNALVDHRDELWDAPLYLWWIGDGVKDGVAFSACPFIGNRWYISYHTNRYHSIILKAAGGARVGAVLRPSEAKFFAAMEKACRALAGKSMALLEEFSTPEMRAKETLRLEKWSGKGPQI